MDEVSKVRFMTELLSTAHTIGKNTDHTSKMIKIMLGTCGIPNFATITTKACPNVTSIRIVCFIYHFTGFGCKMKTI